MRYPLSLFLLQLFSLLPAASLELLTPATEVDTDHIIEWRIADADESWLEFDIRNTPLFYITGPDGKTYARAAFLYQEHQRDKDDQSGSGLIAVGERELRVRHQGRQPGIHQWKLMGPKGRIIGTGSLDIAAGKEPLGVIKISDYNPQLLSFQNEDIFIPIGCNIGWAEAPSRLELMQTYMRKLAANGGTHFRMWLCSWSGQIESGASGMYRLDHAWLVDEILRSARHTGLYVTIVLDNHHDLLNGLAFPYGSDTSKRIDNFLGLPLNEQYKLRLQYIFARYGCDNHIMAWELFNELDEALYNQMLPAHMPDMQQICAKWVPAAAQFVQSVDQDNHLVTSSLSWQTWSEVVAANGLDLVQVHQYIPVFDKVHPLHHDGLLPLQAHLPRLRTLNKPFRFSEVGHNGTNERNPANKLDPGGLLLRQQTWAGFLFGGYGSGMNWWWDVYIDDNDLWQCYQPLATITKMIDWQDRDLKALPVNKSGSLRVIGWQSHRQALLWPQIRANTWYALTVDNQKPDTYRGQQLRIRGFLPETRFQIQWLSLRDGHKHSEINALSDSAGRLLVQPPANQLELVAVIRKAR